jgi:predicted NACHT family NTPase
VDRAVTAITSMQRTQPTGAFQIDPGRASSCLLDHLKMLEKWSSEIRFRDLLRTRKLADSFVDLECQVGELTAEEQLLSQNPLRVTALLNGTQHVVLVGRPGAGKTTSIQRLALTVLSRYDSPTSQTPILLRLRELVDGESVLDRLANLTGLDFRCVAEHDNTEGLSASERRELQRLALSAYLDEIKAVVFLDGLDECPQGSRAKAERDIKDLMEHAVNSKIYLTCRNSDYGFRLPAQAYTILPLSPDQVRKFALKWLGVKQADTFVNQLALSPYHGAEVLPITIAHLCAIYERRGAIPPQPRFVYQKIVRLLLEEWDEQRGIQRSSKYAEFGIDRKLEFLRRIAFELSGDGRRVSFTHAQLEAAYLRCNETFGLPRNEYMRVTREIESHNGLIAQSSYERFEFAHRSIQEYLTAEYLLRLPRIPDKLFLQFGEEIAIATALSSRADQYLESLTESLLSFPPNVAREAFARTYLSRLLAENPDLPSEQSLGWTILVLAELTDNDAKQETSKQSRLFRHLHALCTHEATRGSIRSAVQGAVRIQTPAGELRLIAPRTLRLPDKGRSYLLSHTPGVAFENEVVHGFDQQDDDG